MQKKPNHPYGVSIKGLATMNFSAEPTQESEREKKLCRKKMTGNMAPLLVIRRCLRLIKSFLTSLKDEGGPGQLITLQ